VPPANQTSTKAVRTPDYGRRISEAYGWAGCKKLVSHRGLDYLSARYILRSREKSVSKIENPHTWGDAWAANMSLAPSFRS
jgi:hypothetical protein